MVGGTIFSIHSKALLMHLPDIATRIHYFLFFFLGFFYAQTAHAQPAFQWVNGGGGNNSQLTGNNQPFQDAKLLSADNRGHLYSFNVLSPGGVTIDTFHRNGTYNNYPDLILCSWTCGGKLRWARTMGDIYWEEPYGIATDTNGNVYVCGNGGGRSASFKINDTLAGSPGGGEVFIAKYDSMGRMKWLTFPGKTATVNSGVRGVSMKMGPDGKLQLFAELSNFPNNLFEGFPILPNPGSNRYLYRIKVDTGTASVTAVSRFQGITTGERFLRVDALEIDPFGNTYMKLSGDTVSVLGETGFVDTTRYDDIFAAFDNNGNPRWSKKISTLNPVNGVFPPLLGLNGMQYAQNSLYIVGVMSKSYNYYGISLINPNTVLAQNAGIILNLNATTGDFNGYKTVRAGDFNATFGVALTAVSAKPGSAELVITGASPNTIILNTADTMKPLLGLPLIIYNTSTQLMRGGRLISTPGPGGGGGAGSSITSDNLGNIFVGGLYGNNSFTTPGGTLPFYGGKWNFFVAGYGLPGGCAPCSTPKPSVTSLIRTGQSVTVKGNTATGTADSLVWVWGDGSTAKNTIPNAEVTHTYAGHQIYNLCLRAYSTCGNKDTCILVSTVAIEEQMQLSGVSLYPNPASNTITLENNTGQLLAYRLYDLYGKLITQGQSTQSQQQIDVQQLPTGSYLIRCQLADGTAASKMMQVVH